jgi:hypothetical protein
MDRKHPIGTTGQRRGGNGKRKHSCQNLWKISKGLTFTKCPRLVRKQYDEEKKVFEEIIAENFSNLVKYINL